MRFRAGRRIAWPAAVTVALGGCGTDPGCDICSTSAVVYGRVTRGGVSLPGATVTATVHADSCAGPLAGNESLPVATDAQGRYRVQPRAFRAPFLGCVLVRARADTGGEAATESDPVRFLADYRPRGRDSVRVDVVLPSP